jgi:hypothetical protein
MRKHSTAGSILGYNICNVLQEFFFFLSTAYTVHTVSGYL